MIISALILLRMASDRPETIAVTTSITNTTVTTTTSTTTITPTTTAPALYDIPLSDELQQYTIELCKQYGVGPELVFALMGAESEYQPDVISKTGDYGLMQINKVNHGWIADELGINDILDARQNIKAGVYMLSQISRDYDTLQEILMVYNCGEGGAQLRWKRGIYKTAHTEKVLRRMESLKRKGD